MLFNKNIGSKKASDVFSIQLQIDFTCVYMHIESQPKA